MLFWFQNNGNRQQVIIKTQPLGSEWLACAVLLPLTSGESEMLLRTVASQTAVQLRSPTEQEAIDRMALILKNVYGCTLID